MATIQDIFDWLNQGAQGDIPGTGGSQPSPSSSSQSAQPANQASDQSQAQPAAGKKPDDYRPVVPSVPSVPPSAYEGAQTAPTPQDYSGDIPPTLLPQYNALVKGGLPPMVAYQIMTQPSQGEGEPTLDQTFHVWPYAYQGQAQDFQEHLQSPPQQPLEQHMWDQYFTRQQNLPTWEGHTPGEDDSLGFTRLPSGQYLPSSWNPGYPRANAPPTGWDEHNQTVDDATLNDMLSNPDFMDMLLGSR